MSAKQIKHFEILFIILFIFVTISTTYLFITMGENDDRRFYAGVGILGLYILVNKIHLIIIDIFQKEHKNFRSPILFVPLHHYMMHSIWPLLFVLMLYASGNNSIVISGLAVFFGVIFFTSAQISTNTINAFTHHADNTLFLDDCLHINRYRNSMNAKNDFIFKKCSK